jgi:hypothetical protein
MAAQFVRFLSVLLVACIPALASAQVPESPNPAQPAAGPLPPHSVPAHPVFRAEPVDVDPAAPNTRPDALLPEWLHPRAEGTQLFKFGERGLGVTELEAKLGIDIPILDVGPPIQITPGVAGRWFEGATSSNRPDLPSSVVDLYVDFSWRPRLAEWLFVDLKITPGFYSDLHNTSGDAFRMRGHGMAIVALSEKFQIMLGAAYVNRYNFKIVPIGGFRWLPDEDTEIRLLVPAPKISRRIANYGDAKISVYLSGDYGGGFYAVRRDSGQDDVIDYSDFRLLTGVEAELPGERRWYAEVGYVFNRRIDYVSLNPTTIRPTDTVLLRMGIAY